MKFINFLNKNKFFIIFLIFGLLIFTYPMLKSNFDLMPGDGVDVKLFTYLLEHSRLWLMGVETHEELWNVPFFYPEKNTLAYSDALIGIMPLYWIIRIFFSMFSAVQVLMILMCVLNYSTFYYLLTKHLKYGKMASAIGAFIFAFGVLRYYRMVHLNYYCQFYSILSLIFLLNINLKNSILKNNIYFFLSSTFMVLQFYSCYTLGYYFCIISFLGVLTALFYKNYRDNIFHFIKNFYVYIVCYFIYGIIILIPFILHYLNVGETRTISDVLVHMQEANAWLRSPSALDSFFVKIRYGDYFLRNECCAGIGIITTIFSIVGIWYTKKYRWILYFLLILIFFASVRVFSFVLWEYLFPFLPGAQGIRVIVRIVYISLIIFSFGIAAFVDYHYRKFKISNLSKILLISSVVMILLEQIPYNKDSNTQWTNFNWSKSAFEKQIEEASRGVTKSANAIKFVVIPLEPMPTSFNSYEYVNAAKYVDSVYYLASFVALKTNKYSVNGISGMGISKMIYDSEWVYTKYFYYLSTQYDNNRYLMGKSQLFFANDGR